MKWEGLEADAVAISVFLMTTLVSLIGMVFKVNRSYGPLLIPIFGNLLNIFFHRKYPDIPSVFCDMAEKWGSIMSLKIGKNETVVFSSHESATAILQHKHAMGRVVGAVMRDRLLHKNIGINFSNGSEWHEMRKFTITSLKSFGMGKFSSEILDEVHQLIKYWDLTFPAEEDGLQKDVHFQSGMFGGAVFNVVWRLLSGGQRFEYGDEKLQRLLHALERFNQSANLGVDVFAPFPGLRDLLPSKWTGKGVQKESLEEIRNFCFQTLKERKANMAKGEEEPTSFFDTFAMKILESSGSDGCFNDDQFVITTMDMFQNAVDTVGSTLNFLVLYAIMNPDARKKCQEEIHLNLTAIDIATSSLDASKSLLPYLFAFIMETMRFSCALPVIAPRLATDNINLDGFHIKAGTSLLVNLRALNSSKDAWNDPENFRPERFLDSTTSQLDISKTRLMMSFGAGKRVCPAQKFSEQMLFIFFVELLKNYDFLPATKSPLPSITKAFGLSYSPKPFYAQVRRKNTYTGQKENTV